MDTTDLALCRMLLENSRVSIREIGDRLGLSVAAVHGRVQALRDAGIIKAFTARLSLVALQASLAILWGTSHAASNEELVAKLRPEEHVYWVAFAGAGTIYVGTYLRSATELDSVVAFVSKEAQLREPNVGLVPMGAGLPERPIVDHLDARILRALHRDARKSVAEVAEEIGISAKTVGRRLNRMIEKNLAEFSIEWYPDTGNDVITMWHLEVGASASRDEALARLANGYGKNLLFTFVMGNFPRSFLAATWTGSMKELRDLQGQLTREKVFARTVPDVIYTGYLFDTWRDDLLMKWAGPKERST